MITFDFCENCNSDKIETFRKDENTYSSICYSCGCEVDVVIKKAAITAAS